MAAKFEFFEVVRIDAAPEESEELDGKTGPIVGMAESEDGRWTYSIYLENQGGAFIVNEDRLTSTGRFVKREDIYDGSSMRVAVDPKTGEGKLVE